MRRPKAALLALTMLAVLVVPVTPAAAADAYVCTYLASPSTTTWKYGTIRKLGSPKQHIVWSFTVGTGCTISFPSGGSIDVSVRFYEKNSSGGCTSTVKSNGTTIATFTGTGQSKYIAKDVLATTCYAVRWKARNSTSAGVNHHGKLWFQNA